MCTTKVSPTLVTMSPLASISIPELSMATCPRGSLSTAKISPADAATARCTSSRSVMCPLSPERHNGQGRARRTLAIPGKPGDGGAGERDLCDVVAAGHRGGACPLSCLHLHAGDHHALAAEPSDVLFQPAPGVVPRLVHQLGPAGHLDIAGPPARLARRAAS